MSSLKIECVIIRGGTTKGVFIDSTQLPTDSYKRDKLILSLFGSPDTRQINGLGGGDPLTSKVALISLSSDADADIDYQSGEVGIDESSINYSTMCGNLAAGASLFALEMGLIKKISPITEIRIRNLNTGKYLLASIPIANGGYVIKSCKEIDGVAGYGTEINLTFKYPSGAITGDLLPTGKPVNKIFSGENKYICSVVDCGTLYAFIDAKSFNLTGSESPEKLDNMTNFREQVELIRTAIAKKISLYKKVDITSKQIKIAIFSYPDNERVEGKIVARVINRYKTHKAYPVTGAICISAATMIPGTVLYREKNLNIKNKETRIHHPGGLIITETIVDERSEIIKILSATIKRSSRILMRGTADIFFPG